MTNAPAIAIAETSSVLSEGGDELVAVLADEGPPRGRRWARMPHASEERPRARPLLSATSVPLRAHRRDGAVPCVAERLLRPQDVLRERRDPRRRTVFPGSGRRGRVFFMSSSRESTHALQRDVALLDADAVRLRRGRCRSSASGRGRSRRPRAARCRRTSARPRARSEGEERVREAVRDDELRVLEAVLDPRS